MARFALFAVAALIAWSRSTALAEQVVVVDVMYEHSSTTTTDSHFYPEVLSATPSSFVSPVDYADGTAWVRLEVFTKPSDAPTRYQICFEGTPSYACTQQAPTYTTTGVYTWNTPFHDFYQYDHVDWTEGTRRIALILKDDMNGKPAPENVGEKIAAMYMPTRLRVTVTLVSPGGTYVPPNDTVDAGVAEEDAGAGSMDAGDGSEPRDAAAPDDAESPGEDADRAPAPKRLNGNTCTATNLTGGRSLVPGATLALICLVTRRRKKRGASRAPRTGA